jgi:hypothetical protein
MSNKPEDISHIARDVLRTGELTKEHVSELARMTAKQIYSQGYQAGEMASKIDTWNEAIEAAAKLLNDEGSGMPADKIRKLRK